MRIPWRQAGAWLLVGVGAIWVAWLGGQVQTLGDYPGEFAAPMSALLDGRVSAFAHLLPADGAGGSLILRAPAALLGKLLFDTQLGVFRFGALGCELAAGALGMALARDMRRRGIAPAARVATVGLCVLLAMLLDAIYFGHPEETLGATLCVSAVLLAGAERPTLAGLVLGCAIINKPWGVLAVPAALLASPSGLWRTCLATGGVVVGWLALNFGLAPAHFAKSLSDAESGVLVAHPPDLWWPLGRPIHDVGTTPYYTPPPFLVNHARQLAVLVSIPLALPLALRRLSAMRRAARAGAHSALHERSRTDSALALLALSFLLRCALDPSNHVYYSLPFVMALLAWESRVRRAPVFSLLAAGWVWLTFHTIAGVGTLTMQYASYMALLVTFGALLVGPATGSTPRWPTIDLRRRRAGTVG